MSPSVRSALLVGVIVFLTAAVIGNAYVQRQQFYPTVVYITKSNASMGVMYVQILVLVVLLGKVMRKIFFGSLRTAEFEHLMERSWYAVTETCLAFTVFKDDFSPKFVALFTVLLFLKSFHWLLEDRVDYMERSPSISILFHIRVLSLSVILIFFDSVFIMHAYNSTLTKGASVQLVFGFEYAVLLTILANTLVKYGLHSADLSSENPWDNKAVFMLYTELAVGFVKVLLYVLFVAIMVRIYTLPLFAVRPMYLTMRAFKKAFNDVILSRRAIYNMNTWYPDATQEELNNTDNVCIICREEMLAPTTKKLPCNHIFHKSCLRSWFQRQQTCPTCRLDVLQAPQSARQQRAQQPPPQQPNPPQPPQVQPHQPIMGFPFQGMDPNVFVQLGQGLRPPNVIQPNNVGFPQGGPRIAGAQPTQQANASGNQPQTAQTAAPAPGQPLPNNFPFPFNTHGAIGPNPANIPSTSPSSPPTMPNLMGLGCLPNNIGLSPPPFLLPFLPPPTFFAMPPAPPQPPANFSGLSQADLMAMEGTERQNVEARIKVLRNIQTLLDAAVFEMQQYSAVAARLNVQATPIPTCTTQAADIGSGDSSTSEATMVFPDLSSLASSETTTVTSHADTGARPKIPAQRQTVEEELINKMDEGESFENSNSEHRELRKRRLEKFGQP